jgi:hypothetical protein
VGALRYTSASMVSHRQTIHKYIRTDLFMNTIAHSTIPGAKAAGMKQLIVLFPKEYA